MKNQLLLVNQALKTVIENQNVPKLKNEIIQLKRKIKKYKECCGLNEDHYIKSCSLCRDLGSVYYDSFDRCNNCLDQPIVCKRCSEQCAKCYKVYCNDCSDEVTLVEDWDTQLVGGVLYWCDAYICNSCMESA